MPLGLGASLSKASIVAPGVVTDSLVMKHMYPAGAVQKLSDGSAFFDGSNDYIDMGSDSSLDIGTSHMTVAGWVYWDGTDNVSLFTKGRNFAGANYDTYGWAVGIYSTSISTPRLYFDVHADGSGGADSVRFAHYIEQSDLANKWHHVACSRGLKNGTSNDGRYRIYVDGVLESEKYATDGDDRNGSQGTDGGDLLANDGTISDAGNSFRLGADSNNSQYLGGYISNCGLWKRELTQAEIKSIMFKQYVDFTTSEKTSLVSWWNLDNNLTTQGSSSWVADEVDTTFDSNVTPTWTSSNGAVIDGQTITLGSSGVVSALATISPVGVYKVNVTVTGYTGSGNIEMPWDGSGSSNMQISANGTYEFYEKSSDTGWLIYAADGRGATITINSITKANGNIGELL